MTIALAAYAGLPAVTLLICCVLAYWIHTRHGDVRGSRWFVVMLVLTAAWMGLHVVWVLATDEAVVWTSSVLALKAAAASFLAWVVFASRYSGAEFHRRPAVGLLLGLQVAQLFVPTFLEPFASALYAERTFVAEPFAYVLTEPAPLFLAVAVVLMVLLGLALFSLVRYLLATPEHSSGQLILLVAGSLSIGVATALGNFGVFPARGPVNGAFGALPFAVLTSVALFRFRLFEMEPVARNAVVEQLRDPVLVLDDELTVVDYNAASAELWPSLGRRGEASLEGTCPELAAAVSLPPDGDEDAPEQVAIVVDGRSRHFSVRASAVGAAGGTPRWYSVVLRDVTDLERSRWQLAQQNERLDQVGATISHDLRNPINVASAYAELVGDLLADGPLDDEGRAQAREYLEKVHGAHARMVDIIDDVLLLAREGKTVEGTERVALADVARDAWGTVDTKEATLSVVDDRQLAADRSKLLLLFENLFRNAVEHGGPEVSVTVRGRPDGFAVEDDGPGIPPEHAESVFEYGYSTAEEGTGLGLSIVSTLAGSHGWTVGVDESYDDGARFVVRNVGEEPVGDANEGRAVPPPIDRASSE